MCGALCARSDCWFRRMIKIQYPIIYDRYKPSQGFENKGMTTTFGQVQIKSTDKQERNRNEQVQKHIAVHMIVENSRTKSALQV